MTTQDTTVTTDTTPAVIVALSDYQRKVHSKHRSVLANIPQSLKDDSTTATELLRDDAERFVSVITIRDGVEGSWAGEIGADGRYRLDFEDGKLYGLGKAQRIYKLTARVLMGDYSVPLKLAEGINDYATLKGSHAARVEARLAVEAASLEARRLSWEVFNIPQGFELSINASSPWVYSYAEAKKGSATIVVTYHDPSEDKANGEWIVTKAVRSNPTAEELASFLNLTPVVPVIVPVIPASKPFKPAKAKKAPKSKGKAKAKKAPKKATATA